MDKNRKITAVNIEWHNTHLHIELDVKEELDIEFFLVGTSIFDKPIKEQYPIELVRINNKNILKLNITTVSNGRKPLDEGTWKICYETSEGIRSVNIDVALAQRVIEMGRAFVYEEHYSYIFNFEVISNVEDESDIYLVFKIYYMMRNPKPKKRNPRVESRNITELIKNLIIKFLKFGINVFYIIVSRLSIRKGKNVLLISETRAPISGNLKFLDDRIKERGLDKKFNISYSFRRVLQDRPSVIFWARMVYLIARQDYVFVDDYIPVLGFIDVDKRTKIIQVWHAGVGFKTVGYSRFGRQGCPAPFASCHRKYTHAIVASENIIDVYQDVFGIEKEAIYPYGMPRLDNYLDEKKIAKFKEDFYKEHPNMQNKKIILFAPTFRGKGQGYAYYNIGSIDTKKLYEVCGDEYIVLFKFHPFINERVEIAKKYRDRLFEFTDYPDINELFYVTEVLITDYSSNIYEFSLFEKPIIFYDYDKALYEVLRGVHHDIDENSPGVICATFDEVLKVIENGNFDYLKVKEFARKNHQLNDNNACDRIIDNILLGDKKL